MDKTIVENLREDVLLNLEQNILPYWIDNMVDPRSGFYGRRDGNDTLHADAPKGAVLNARILWTFSSAYRLLGRQQYLDMATRAKREIIDKFYDPEYGGVYWSIGADGNPLDTKKQFYAIGFAIYGLSEYARATGDAEALDYAMRLFRDIEAHSRDRVNGGYFEALTRDWTAVDDMRLSDKDMNSTKTMNTHLHIIEPYTNLLRVSGDESVREATESLLNLFAEKIVLPDNRGHMGLFFDDEWRLVDRGIISYGHDIEASWLLLETAQVLGDSRLTDRVLEVTSRIADAAFEGLCPDGSMIYERHADGKLDTDRHWWVQAENVVGQMYLYLYHGRRDMLQQAYRSWLYIRDNLVDESGEWIWSVSDGQPNRRDDKAGFWKCPYHNSRMCLEIIEHLVPATV